MAITLDGTNGIETPTINGTAEHVTSVTGFKNRIINGAMVIDQRNAHASFTVGTGATSFVADRFFCYSSGGQTFGANSAGLPAGSGFNYGLTLLPQTGATSVQLTQKIESYNAMDLAAQTVTLSFWLYTSSLSGTASYVQPYTPTAQDNYAGINYGASQALSYTNGAWVKNTFTFSSSNGSMNFANGAAILFNFVSAVGATIWVTGVQLEKGSTATSFDYRPYGTELSLCQRYFQTCIGSFNYRMSGQFYTTTSGRVIFNHYVPMRTAPSLSVSGLTGQAIGFGTTTFSNNNVNQVLGIDASSWDLTGATVAKAAYQQLTYDGTAQLSAEL